MGTRVLLVGMQNAVATAEDIMEVPQKFKTKILKIKNRIKNGIALWTGFPLLYIPKKMKSRVSNMFVYQSSIIHNS